MNSQEDEPDEGGPKAVGEAKLEAEKTPSASPSKSSNVASSNSSKRKKLLVARPFGAMRGHTAFLTFATAGNKRQPNPNQSSDAKEEA